MFTLATVLRMLQWVETNPSNIHICPTDICFAALRYYADGIDTDVKYGCLQMLDWFVFTHPAYYHCCRQWQFKPMEQRSLKSVNNC
jgi:hypothetical protein